MPAASGRRFYLKARSQRRLHSRPAGFHRDAVFCAEIDPIEPPPTPKDWLSSVNVHHNEVAAECLRHSRRTHDAANREWFLAFNRQEWNLVVDSDFVPLGEFSRDHQRVGLGKKN